ncbi:MAG: FAD synthetase family protein [Spirochaetes bacterium]|nr:FAD synthetase family protein [Spirochaetota bacterium]
MKVIDWEDFTDADFYIKEPSGVTIGTFDGLHKGHIHLLKRLFAPGIEERVVFTFKENPAWFFRKKNFPGDIYTLSQKIDVLKRIGITTTVLIDFSDDFSKLKGNYFISCITDHLNLVKMVIGEDFKCGKDNDTTANKFFDLLEPNQVFTEIVKRQPLNGVPISSSLIREFINEGQIDQAEQMLEFGYAVDLKNIDVQQENNCYYIYKNQTRQVLPDNGRYNLNILKDNITFEKEVVIDNIFLKWFKKYNS